VTAYHRVMTDIGKDSRVRTKTGRVGTVLYIEPKPDGTTITYVMLDGDLTPGGTPFNITDLEVVLGG
jgi:hypothetical protein